MVFLAVSASSLAASAPPRIQFLAPGDVPREFGCAGTAADGSGYVLAWSSTFVVVKIDGAVRRLTPAKASEFPKADMHRGDRIRQEWISGPVFVILDLLLTRVCPPDDDRCDGSSWEGDLTAQIRNGVGAGSRKTIRIQIECGC
jgi:hypothetical protein